MKKSSPPKSLVERAKIQIYAPKELITEARIMAVVEGKSFSSLVCDAVSEYLKNNAKP